MQPSLRATATRTASSDSLRPTEAMGAACNQSPEHHYYYPYYYYRHTFVRCSLRAGACQSQFAGAVRKQSSTAADSAAAGVRRADAGWYLTLAPAATGRPADWAVAEARLAGDAKGSRREMLERTIGEVVEAHVNTNAHLAKNVQRGLKRYRAINGVSTVASLATRPLDKHPSRGLPPLYLLYLPLPLPPSLLPFILLPISSFPFPSLPTPSPPTLSYPSSPLYFQPFPSPSLPSSPPLVTARRSEDRYSSPSGSVLSPAAELIFVQFSAQNSVAVFKLRLKTFLFSQAFPSFSAH